MAARLAFRQDTVEELRTVDAWYIASDATDAVVALLALLVVRRITERLEARGAEAPAPLPWQPPQAPVASGADWSPTAPERPAAER